MPDVVCNNPPDRCSACGAEYRNIQHPMKPPGVIIQRLCDCKLVVTHVPGGQITILVPPEKPE